MEAPNDTKEGRAVAWVSRAHPFHALYMNCLHPSYSSEQLEDGAMEFVCFHCYAIFHVEPHRCEHKRMTQNGLWCHDCCTPSKLHDTLLEQRGRASPLRVHRSADSHLSSDALQQYLEAVMASNAVKLIASVDRHLALTKQGCERGPKKGLKKSLEKGLKKGLKKGQSAALRLHVVRAALAISQRVP